MGYTIKLDIYYFSIRRIIKTEHRKVIDVVRTIHKTEKHDSTFREFVQSINFEGDDAMSVILQDFIRGFNSSFKFNQEKTQALSITTEPFSGFSSSKNTIWGLFKGGTTGINQEVYASDNSLVLESLIDASKVASLKYFFKVWMPLDSNVGVLIIQSYTSIGCSSLFREQIGNYFISKGYKITEWAKFVPQQYIENYIKHGFINQFQIVYKKKSETVPLSPIFKTVAQARHKTIIDNFVMSLNSLVKIPDYKNFLKSQIKAIVTDYDEEEDGLTISYVDETGQKLSTSLAKIDDILPKILLEEDMMDRELCQPKWDKLHFFTDTLLEDFKRQMHYSPVLI